MHFTWRVNEAKKSFIQNPAMQHRHREVLGSILKIYGGTTPQRNVSPHPNVPTPQDHLLQQMLYQQQHQQQQRIPSPMNNGKST